MSDQDHNSIPAEEQESIDVIDNRHEPFFIVDHAFFDEFVGKLSPAAVLVYLCLCRHADRRGKSYPSVDAMSADLHMQSRTVKAALSVLKKLKLIDVQHRFRADGSQTSNLYTLLQIHPRVLSQTPPVSGPVDHPNKNQIEQESERRGAQNVSALPKITNPLKTALATLCYGPDKVENAWKTVSLRVQMIRALKDLLVLQPDLTPQHFEVFRVKWADTWRGKAGERPIPKYVVEEWIALNPAKPPPPKQIITWVEPQDFVFPDYHQRGTRKNDEP